MLRKLTTMAASAAAAGIALVAVAPAQQQLCFGAAPTITGAGEINGTAGDDVVLGSEGADDIHTQAGNDKICAGGGADRVGGGPGNDEIDGGPGDDTIDSGPGADRILGGEGDDTIRCGTENDVVDGGPGANTAERSGFEACETVTNASPPRTGTTPQANPVRAALSPRQAVPRPRDVTRRARGVLSGTLTPTATGATLRWRLTFSGLTGPARAAHVHLGRPGETGRVLARLCAPCEPGERGTSQVRGQPARMALNQGNAYVDVHTARNPRGEIRGRFLRTDR